MQFELSLASPGDDQMLTELQDLLRHTRTTAIVGDSLRIRARDVGPRNLATIENHDGERTPMINHFDSDLAQVPVREGTRIPLKLEVQWVRLLFIVVLVG